MHSRGWTLLCGWHCLTWLVRGWWGQYAHHQVWGEREDWGRTGWWQHNTHRWSWPAQCSHYPLRKAGSPLSPHTLTSPHLTSPHQSDRQTDRHSTQLRHLSFYHSNVTVSLNELKLINRGNTEPTKDVYDLSFNPGFPDFPQSSESMTDMYVSYVELYKQLTSSEFW